jgi:hypothetical protein
MKDNYVKQILLILTIIAVGVTLNYCSNDYTALTTTTYLYLFTAVVPVLLIFLFAFKKGGIFSETFNVYLISALLFFAIVYSIITFIYSKLDDNSMFLLGYISNILSFCMLIIGLAIIHKVFVNNIMRLGGTPKFLLSLLFFIPCLLNDFILSIKQDFVGAPSLAYFLIFMEFILLILYFSIKWIIDTKMIKNEVMIHDGKFFLDTKKEINLANIVELRGQTERSSADLLDSISKTKPLSYALSLWIQINQPEVSNIEIPILLYGDNSNPKPKMTYKSDSNVLNVAVSGGTNMDIPIEHQKWNHIVFNYNGTTVDIFLNGLLHKTMNLSNSVPVHHLSDTITIGNNDLILSGALANITYYVEPLSAYQILAKYRFGINTINL